MATHIHIHRRTKDADIGPTPAQILSKFPRRMRWMGAEYQLIPTKNPHLFKVGNDYELPYTAVESGVKPFKIYVNSQGKVTRKEQ